MTINKPASAPDYMLIGETSGGVLMRKCGKTISATEERVAWVLSIPGIDILASKYIIALGLEPFRSGKEYVGTRRYRIEQDDTGNLGFVRLRDEATDDENVQYFIHSETRQIIAIYYQKETGDLGICHLCYRPDHACICDATDHDPRFF